MSKSFDAITKEPPRKADAIIIWLHGLGADGYDFADVIPSLGLRKDHTYRFVFPHAPSMPVTLNAGFVMPAWYDIEAIDSNAAQDEKGIRKSEEVLSKMMDNVIQSGIASTRIILMGFSQGGALALHTALRFAQPLAGVGVLSAYLPLHPLLPNEHHQANGQIPVFMAHGLADPVVPYMMGQSSYEQLISAGLKPQWHAYPMAHSVCVEELKDIGTWIQDRLPPL